MHTVPSQYGVIATYQVQLPEEGISEPALKKWAEKIAIGQTVGTDITDKIENLSSYQAEVITVETSLSGHTPETSKNNTAFFRVGFPLATVESDLGTLLSVVFGKVSMAGAIRLVDLAFSETLQSKWRGPQHGITGIRHSLNRPNGPLLMGIFKPCLGLPPETLGNMFYEYALGGVQLVKDDEVLSDAHFDSALRRLACCQDAQTKAYQETHQKTLYAINLSGPVEELLPRARKLVSEGASALLLNYLCYGLPMLAALRQDPDITIPIIAHPALGGAFYGSPVHGISPKVLFGQLPRLAGADAVLFPSPYGAVCLPKCDAHEIHHALTAAQENVKPSFSVPSAGIQAHMVPQILADFGPDVVINAGTGIADHPDGIRAGAVAFCEAIAQASSALLMSVG